MGIKDLDAGRGGRDVSTKRGIREGEKGWVIVKEDTFKACRYTIEVPISVWMDLLMGRKKWMDEGTGMLGRKEKR